MGIQKSQLIAWAEFIVLEEFELRNGFKLVRMTKNRKEKNG